MSEERVRNINITTQPARYEIEMVLLENPAYISDIVKKLGINRRVVIYHLRVLERYGFVKTYLKETGKTTPVSERFAEPTQKLIEMEPLLSSLA
jgi:predicted transcriptional regulator